MQRSTQRRIRRGGIRRETRNRAATAFAPIDEINHQPRETTTSRQPQDITSYDFLRAAGLTPDTLWQAEQLALYWSSTPHQVLISNGVLTAETYAQCAAMAFKVDYFPPEASILPAMQPVDLPGHPWMRPALLRHSTPGERLMVIDPAKFPLPALNELLRSLTQDGVQLAFTSARGMRRAVLARHGSALLDQAVYGLARAFPQESAIYRTTAAQRLILTVLAASLGAGFWFYPWPSFYALSLLLSLAFFWVVVLRGYALLRFWRQRSANHLPASKPLADALLPSYSVLVPLYQEAEMLPELMAALERLDYPKVKLDIKLILEQSDPATLQAALALDLPGNVDIVIVPDAEPRTKPKALNYALQFASGTLAVIYDAEDRPEPQQLRQAAAAFRAAPEELACVQAPLNVYNRSDNWLTRQFTIEYSSLFDAILPALAACRLPLPLGGTSNHFRLDLLRQVGAWDAFNVTEDADLGLRLARHGFVSGVIEATTFEEACRGFGPWIRQRTRWMKGWMQTYLVHMRNPLVVWRALGTRNFIALQVLMGAQIIAALAHPLFLAMLGIELFRNTALAQPETLFGAAFWTLAVFNLGFGYLVTIVLGLLTARTRGFHETIFAVLTLPVYWLLVSIAAYRALGQLLTRPHYWEKTPHGCANREMGEQGSANSQASAKPSTKP